MITLFSIVLWAGLAALVVAAALRVHSRRRELLASSVPMVDDDAIERILTKGELRAAERLPTDLPFIVEDEEPLDPREIDDEEERFWSESWDEPTEW